MKVQPRDFILARMAHRLTSVRTLSLGRSLWRNTVQVLAQPRVPVLSQDDQANFFQKTRFDRPQIASFSTSPALQFFRRGGKNDDDDGNDKKDDKAPKVVEEKDKENKDETKPEEAEKSGN